MTRFRHAFFPLISVLIALAVTGTSYARQDVFIPTISSGVRLNQALVTIIDTVPKQVPLNLPTAVAEPGEPVEPSTLTFGPVSGNPGDIITINGLHFADVALVLFGTTPSEYIVVSETELQAIVPPGALSGTISVITLQGSSNLFTVGDAPEPIETPGPVVTSVPTIVPVPPTATAVPVLPTVTAVPVLPTATAVPVLPTATAVPVLPTATAVPVLPTATAVPVLPTPTSGPVTVSGKAVWIDHAALMALPTSGPAWEAVLSLAKSATADGANLNDFGSTHSRSILAAALAGVRLNDAGLIAKAKAGLTDAIGTEEGAEWVAPARVLGSYIIAADVLEIRSGPIYEWLARFKTRTLSHNNQNFQMTLWQNAWDTASNGDSQSGFVMATLGAYTHDKVWLDEAWSRFRRYAGDTSSPWTLKSNQFGDPWQMTNTATGRVGILPVGAFKNGLNIDGSLTNDMGRANPVPVNPLAAYDDRMSLYPWVGLDGAFMTAVVLQRQGYTPFQIQDRALCRALVFLKRISVDQHEPRWWAEDKKEDAKWAGHIACALPLNVYPIHQPVANHDMTTGIDWTHATAANFQ